MDKPVKAPLPNDLRDTSLAEILRILEGASRIFAKLDDDTLVEISVADAKREYEKHAPPDDRFLRPEVRPNGDVITGPFL